MSKKTSPKEKAISSKHAQKTTDNNEEVFHQDTDLDMKLSIERRKKGLPDPGLKTPDDYNEDHSMDRNVL